MHTAPLTRQALLDAYHGYGRPRATWLVGAEFERHLLGPDGRPVPYFGAYGVRWLLGELQSRGYRASHEGAQPIALVRDGSHVTLEPGGQFELSGRPHATVQGVHDETFGFASQIDEILQGTPTAQAALGYTPFAAIDEIGWVPKGRYAIMRNHLGQTGPLGLHMMKGTAATQASYDFSDEGDAARKMILATQLAPLITALYANSPWRRGRPSGFATFRGHIWTLTDPARTGMPDAAEQFSFERWVDYLLDVPMMFTRIDGVWAAAGGRTFREWLEGALDLPAPTWADWDLHQTSVFPEVRIKRQIEVRAADCVPTPFAMSFVALFMGLFYCPRALDKARALAARFASHGTKADRFEAACRHGLRARVGGRRMASWADELLDDAREGLARCSPGDERWLEPAIGLAQSGDSPAHLLLDRLGPTPRPAAVRAAVHPHHSLLADAIDPV